MEKSTYFGKEETVGVGALMVILMMIHHLFGFPRWLVDGNDWECLTLTGARITEKLALFGGICVNVFAMISGYALWVKPSAYGSWGARTKRIFRVLTSYWLICALFLVVGALTGNEMPSIRQLGANLLGFETGLWKWANVPFAWYISFYVEFVLLTPVIIWMFSGRKPWHDVAAFIATVAIVRLRYLGAPVTMPLWPLTSVAAGLLAAKYGVIERLGHSVMPRIHWTLLPAVIMAMAVESFLFGRLNPMGGGNWAIISGLNKVVCGFIVLMAAIGIFRGAGHSRTARRIMLFIGGAALELWLMHGLFFMGTCPGQQIIYSLRHPVLILAVTIIICLPLSVAVSRCAGWIFKNIPIFLRTFAVRSTN